MNPASGAANAAAASTAAGSPGTGSTATAGRAGRRALWVTALALVAAAAALGGAAAIAWARVGFQVPLRGVVTVAVPGSSVAPALGPLALLALAAVAAVLATGGWARPLLGVLLLAAAIPPVSGVLAVADRSRLTDAAFAVGSTGGSTAGSGAGAVGAAALPARSVPQGPAEVLAAGPALAAVGALALAVAAVLLLVCGRRMPRMGRRYRVPSARAAEGGKHDEGGGDGAREQLWERMDAGEDPTADPR